MADVANFFVDHAVSDNLGIIANSHLAMTDASSEASNPQEHWHNNLCDFSMSLHSAVSDNLNSTLQPRRLH